MKSISQKRRSFVLRLSQAVGTAGLGGFAPQVFAKQTKGQRANIKSVTLKQSDNGKQRLVFQLDKSIKHKVFTLASPDRVVIDFVNTGSKTALKLGRNKIPTNSIVKKLRQSIRNNNDFRVVLDLSQKAKAITTFKSNGSGHFLEVALTPKQVLKKSSPQKKIKKSN